jgi:hypothetical protein
MLLAIHHNSGTLQHSEPHATFPLSTDCGGMKYARVVRQGGNTMTTVSQQELDKIADLIYRATLATARKGR